MLFFFVCFVLLGLGSDIGSSTTNVSGIRVGIGRMSR